jgi:hypothetical protein
MEITSRRFRVDQVKLRAWWSYRQGLDGRFAGKSPAAVLEATGWMRSVGGSGPYMGLFARCGATRETMDSAVAALEMHELPTARGCTYVLPKRDFALGLRAAQPFTGGELNVARKLGVTDAEIDKLCRAVLEALKKGPLDPDGLRAAVGPASRSLGEAGKKKGVTTTLPLALGKLQPEGEIRRVPINGRLDQQRYKYTIWSPNPLKSFTLSPEEVQTELARLYFSWAGPATIADYQGLSALSGKAAKAVIEPLKLLPVEAGSDRLMLPAHLDEFADFKVPKGAHYTLVGPIDAIAILHRDLSGIVDAADAKRDWPAEKGMAAPGAVKDLPCHAIMDRGRVVGLWEFDSEAQEIVWVPFIKKNAELTAAVKKAEAFVRDDLGDARSFSLDSPKSRAPRIALLRKM